MTGRALVAGVTGISGGNLTRRLLADGWEVSGLCRNPRDLDERVTPLVADLEDADAVAAAVRGTAPTHVFYTTWSRRPTEAENCDVNGRMLRNLLDATGPEGSVRHVAVVTGLKHYLGPFEAYAQGVMADTPFHEDEPRIDAPNFYYAQEDELFAAARRCGFHWSVHRSHTVFGFAVGNAMNMVLTLAAYATICRELGRPFVFPGSRTQWDGVTDVTDADLLADQIIWAATAGAGWDQAFNTANGDVFRWRWLWPQIAAYFGVEPEGFEGEPRPLVAAMAGQQGTWKEIAARHGLVEPDLDRIASWWHTDGDLGRDIEVLTDMNKSRAAGFTATRDTRASFFAYVERYRAARIIP
jgi:nucleoside-diphosphate-sugar epimerase